MIKQEYVDTFKQLADFLKKLNGIPKKEQEVPCHFKTEFGDGYSVFTLWSSGNRQFDVSLISAMGVYSFTARTNQGNLTFASVTFANDIPTVQLTNTMVRICQLIGVIPDGTDIPI